MKNARCFSNGSNRCFQGGQSFKVISSPIQEVEKWNSRHGKNEQCTSGVQVFFITKFSPEVEDDSLHVCVPDGRRKETFYQEATF